jgi:hypothetical protein
MVGVLEVGILTVWYFGSQHFDGWCLKVDICMGCIPEVDILTGGILEVDILKGAFWKPTIKCNPEMKPFSRARNDS